MPKDKDDIRESKKTILLDNDNNYTSEELQNKEKNEKKIEDNINDRKYYEYDTSNMYEIHHIIQDYVDKKDLPLCEYLTIDSINIFLDTINK